MLSWLFGSSISIDERLKQIDNELIALNKSIEEIEKQKSTLLCEKESLLSQKVSFIPPPPPLPFLNSEEEKKRIERIYKILSLSKNTPSLPNTPVTEFSSLYKGKDVSNVLFDIREARNYRKNILPPQETYLIGLAAVHDQLTKKFTLANQE